MIVRFKRFTRTGFLKSVGRTLLEQFFGAFEAELRDQEIELPNPELDDGAYFALLARLLAGPEALPDSLNEALFALDDLASPLGQEQLEIAIAKAGLPIAFLPGSSRADLAVQVWLAAPHVLARVHNAQRLLRLSAFAHYGTDVPPDQAPPLLEPTPTVLARLAEVIDPWFVRHHRGLNTTRIEFYSLGLEQWFLIRHGDTFSRTPKVDEQKTEIIHFRPERDDVVVYSPEQDEVRINTRTRGERDLYAKKFGLCLRGDEGYFSRRRTYTLEPLRVEGVEALDATGIDGVQKIVLRAVEVMWEDGREVVTREADDIFRSVSALGSCPLGIPEGGRLARAAFDFHFTGTARPRPLEIRLPNILKVGRHCDFHPINTWLSRRGFRTKALSTTDEHG